MLPEFSAEQIAFEVLAELERKRDLLVDDPAQVGAAVEEALAPIGRAYSEAELPAKYFEALTAEVRQIVPASWRKLAEPFTARERRDFDLWRGGDPVARVTYVLVGLVIGGIIIEIPFIPIWQKWFPFLLAIFAYWLPSAQVRFHRRRYARQLGEIAERVGRAQPRLDGIVSTEELLLPKDGGQ